MDTRPDSEHGVTLIELMITLLLFSVVGTAIFTSFMSVHGAADHVAYRSSDQAYARTGVAVLSRDLRVATTVPGSSSPAFRVAKSHEVEFTAAVGSFDRPDLVRIGPDGSNQIVETTIPPKAGSTAPDFVYDPNDEVVRYVARFLVDGQPSYFRYYDADGDELVPPGTGSLNAANRRAIARVQIEFTIREDQRHEDRTTTVRTGVRLPNPIG